MVKCLYILTVITTEVNQEMN